ncbi:MAG TPA: hypothetical protein VIT19_11940 [Pyrinomonadaceae bacterium]
MKEKEIKKNYLTALDPVLEQHHFIRRRNDQQWRHRIDDLNELWVHINFGKAIVNPSVGVRYLDLELMLPQDFHPVPGAMTMLQTLVASADIYLIEEGSGRVGRHLIEFGIPFLSKLSNREFVIERLKSQKGSDWPTPSYSHRIRLLPLLLGAEGRVAEANEFLNVFLAESPTRDQIAPGYERFVEVLREKLTG